MEAMAFGKPVVCYITPAMESKHPADLPIVNGNQDNLAGVLAGLLDDGKRRHELGQRGREYVEKYHDARRIAKDLVGIYQQLCNKTATGRIANRPSASSG